MRGPVDPTSLGHEAPPAPRAVVLAALATCSLVVALATLTGSATISASSSAGSSGASGGIVCSGSNQSGRATADCRLVGPRPASVRWQ